LQIDVPAKGIPVRTTADAISQIVMNLVLNARDSMPTGGDILISVYEETKESGPTAILKVIDGGVGMSADVIEKIFDPFFTTKEQGKGTGLGLSMVYGLVQQMGGNIEVTSSVGEGTSFTISIPVSEGQILEDTHSLESAAGDCVRGKTILIAEDEPDLLEIMSETLKEFSMNVLTAKNGNEALVVQDEYQDKIDFLLTDMVMPEMGGLKLAELIKEVRPETHVVFMSGYPVRGEIASVNLPKDAVFMAKPVKPDYLRNVLKQVANGGLDAKTDATIWKA
jgi:CheY-like chemotaxis protein